MAGFNVELPNDLIKQFEQLGNNSEKMIGEMTRAGAERVKSNVQSKVPLSEMANHVKLTRTYKTPSDDGIKTQIYFEGYLPFSKTNRKYFSRRNKSDGKLYRTEKGVPISFLAIMYEYGRSTKPFPTKPFFRKSFKKSEIEAEMLKVQQKYLPKE